MLGGAGDTAASETAPSLSSWGSQSSARNRSVPVRGDLTGRAGIGGTLEGTSGLGTREGFLEKGASDVKDGIR